MIDHVNLMWTSNMMAGMMMVTMIMIMKVRCMIQESRSLTSCGRRQWLTMWTWCEPWYDGRVGTRWTGDSYTGSRQVQWTVSTICAELASWSRFILLHEKTANLEWRHGLIRGLLHIFNQYRLKIWEKGVGGRWFVIIFNSTSSKITILFSLGLVRQEGKRHPESKS